jgi:putative hydrolase of the HAD superfamily
MPRFDLIAFDADDTLWHNERLYEQTQAGVAELLAGYGVSAQALAEQLYQTEDHNIGLFGYGIKSFALSLIETAVELTKGGLSGREVLAILDLARAQLNAPVELMAHVEAAVARLAARYPLMVITKGDLLDQEAKLRRSGLGEFFPDIEVVSDKTPQTYARLFKNHALDPGRLVMVGNALRSDILPVLELGGHAVYVPHSGTWLHEAAKAPAPGTPRFYQLEHLGQLPGLLERLETQADGGHPSA